MNYIYLLHTIREFLPSSTYVVTSALPAGEWALRSINLGIAQTYLDFINVMAYDFSGPWVDSSGHQAQLFTPAQPHNDAARTSCQSAVDYMLAQGVPSEKIVLGVPAYGRSFLGAFGVGQKYMGHGGVDGTFEYRDLPRPGSAVYLDESVGASCCIGGDGGFVSYDTPHTVQMKADYARSRGLGGLFYWPGTGDVSGSGSLILAGFKGMFKTL